MAKDDIDISLMFKMEPKEAVNYLKNKGYKITDNWHEMLADAHAKAFTVAKMSDAQMLKDTHAIVTQAIQEGWSSGKAERKLWDMFVSKGWLKPEGTDGDKAKEKEYKKYMAFRAKTIFRTNMQTAYSASRYLEQLQDADFAPYLQYKCIIDSHTRPEHLALHDKVYRYDDEFWASFYPPNGWGCRCYVINLSQREVEQKGLKVEKTKSGEVGVEDVVVNQKTGKTAQSAFLRNGDNTDGDYLVRTDAGWAHNTGAAAWNIDVKAYNEIKELPPAVKDKFISDMALNLHKKDAYTKWVKSVLDKGSAYMAIEKTITWLKPDVIKRIKEDKYKLETPIVTMNVSQIGHSGINKNDKQALSLDEYFSIYDIINNPDEIYYDFTNKNSTGIAFIRLLAEGKCIKVCTRLNYIDKKRRTAINRIVTVGKVDYISIKNGDQYKRIK